MSFFTGGGVLELEDITSCSLALRLPAGLEGCPRARERHEEWLLASRRGHLEAGTKGSTFRPEGASRLVLLIGPLIQEPSVLLGHVSAT